MLGVCGGQAFVSYLFVLTSAELPVVPIGPCCWAVLVLFPETPPGTMALCAIPGSPETPAALTPRLGQGELSEGPRPCLPRHSHILGWSLATLLGVLPKRIWGIGPCIPWFQKLFLAFVVFLPHSVLGTEVGDLGLLLRDPIFI